MRPPRKSLSQLGKPKKKKKEPQKSATKTNTGTTSSNKWLRDLPIPNIRDDGNWRTRYEYFEEPFLPRQMKTRPHIENPNEAQQLPEEVVRHILTFMNTWQQVMRASSVCYRWYFASIHRHVWNTLHKRYFGVDINPSKIDDSTVDQDLSYRRYFMVRAIDLELSQLMRSKEYFSFHEVFDDHKWEKSKRSKLECGLERVFRQAGCIYEDRAVCDCMTVLLKLYLRSALFYSRILSQYVRHSGCWVGVTQMHHAIKVLFQNRFGGGGKVYHTMYSRDYLWDVDSDFDPDDDDDHDEEEDIDISDDDLSDSNTQDNNTNDRDSDTRYNSNNMNNINKQNNNNRNKMNTIDINNDENIHSKNNTDAADLNHNDVTMSENNNEFKIEKIQDQDKDNDTNMDPSPSSADTPSLSWLWDRQYEEELSIPEFEALFEFIIESSFETLESSESSETSKYRSMFRKREEEDDQQGKIPFRQESQYNWYLEKTTWYKTDEIEEFDDGGDQTPFKRYTRRVRFARQTSKSEKLSLSDYVVASIIHRYAWEMGISRLTERAFDALIEASAWLIHDVMKTALQFVLADNADRRVVQVKDIKRATTLRNDNFVVDNHKLYTLEKALLEITGETSSE